MFINIVASRPAIARLYATDLEKKLKSSGAIVSYIRRANLTEAEYLSTCERILQFENATLIVDNFDHLIANRKMETQLLPDAHLVIIDQHGTSLLKELKERIIKIEPAYAGTGKPVVVSSIDVYNKVGIPKQSDHTDRALYQAATKAKQYVRKPKQT